MTGYGSYQFGDAYVAASASFAPTTYTTTRKVDLGGAKANAHSEADGHNLGATVTSGYNFDIGAVSLEPNVGLNYNYIQRDGFQESGPFGLTGRESSMESLQSQIGVRAAYSFVADDGVKVTPSVNLGWGHEFLDTGGSNNASLSGQGFSVAASETGRDAVLYGAGVVFQLNQESGLFADYMGESRENYDQHMFRVGVRTTW